MNKRVLITGMRGLIGGMPKEHLQQVEGYELTALNRRNVKWARTIQADISDIESIKPDFKGQDIVMVLAAYP
mgnify:CR=1 FL=1